MTAYDLEVTAKTKEKGSPLTDSEKEAAAIEAINMIELTNGGVAAAAAPRIAQKGIGKVAFLFKRYGVSMYYLMYKLAGQSIKGSPENKRMAMKQLGGMMGASVLLSGAQGLPMFGVIAALVNMFTDDDEDDFETTTRKFLGEGMYNGALNYTLGIDAASRVGLSNLLFRSPRADRDKSEIETLIEQIGGPVLSVALGVERGVKLAFDGNVERGTEQMLPAAARNILKSYRYGTEGALTLRGDSIVGDFSPFHIATQAIGFTPAEYSLQLHKNANTKRIDVSTADSKSKLLRKRYIAWRQRDIDGMRDVDMEIREFNRRHPTTKIDRKTLDRSMKSHKRTTKRMYHGITVNSRMYDTLMQNTKEFDKTASLWD